MSYVKPVTTVKNTPTPPGTLPAGWPPPSTAKTVAASTSTPAPVAATTTSPAITPALPENAADLRRLVAKLRTQNEHLRQAYEAQANRKKDEVVEKERQHFQKQIDEYKAYANGEIAKAWAEADHWQEQVRIIYDLLEEQTNLAKQAIAERDELARQLEMTEPKVKSKNHRKAGGKLRRRLEEE